MKVFIADDHHLILSSIKHSISGMDEAIVCYEYNNGDALIHDLPQYHPDIVLLDYHLPDKNGIEITQYIKYHFPDIKVIILTGFEKEGLLFEAFESGCSGFLLKSSTSSATLMEALYQVFEGNIYIDKQVNINMVNTIQIRKTEMSSGAPKLTKREIDIVKEIGNGLTSKEIADKLFISKKTVDNHRKSIMMKTNTKNTAALIKFASDRQLI